MIFLKKTCFSVHPAINRVLLCRPMPCFESNSICVGVSKVLAEVYQICMVMPICWTWEYFTSDLSRQNFSKKIISYITKIKKPQDKANTEFPFTLPEGVSDSSFI